MEFYDALCPYYQNDKIEIRQAEPYSYCQFIMGVDHKAHGRARHPFMTGSGGWAYFSATRYMLGIRPDFDFMEVDPCIPKEWDGFKFNRSWKGCEYEISVENPNHVMAGVKEVYLDGEKVETQVSTKAIEDEHGVCRMAAHIPYIHDGNKHHVKIIMG